MAKPTLTLLIILIVSVLNTFSQTIEFPVWTVKSHANMEIEKIVMGSTEIVIHLIVVSDMDEGAWFCADKNLYLISSESKQKYNILKKVNIPECPQKHIFTKKGEILRFTLFFPPIAFGTKSVDLIEDCNDACFYFRDIVLDKQLNTEIRLFEKSVDNYSSGNRSEAISGFEKIINSCADKTSYRYSQSLSILSILYEETGETGKAKNTYEIILNSNLDDKTKSGSEDEHFSNFKHKASLRLALLYEQENNYQKVLELLVAAEKEYPLQSLDSETGLRKRDYFMIVEKKVKILSELNRLDEAVDIILNDCINLPNGEMPVNLVNRVIKILLDKYGKEAFADSIYSGIETLQTNTENGKTLIVILTGNYKHKINYNGQISEKEVKTKLKETNFYKTVFAQ